MSSKTQEVAIDEILVNRFKRGDYSAFKEMMDRHKGRIYRYVYKRLKNKQDAEEVTQDAFIRVHRSLENFRGDASFSTWLYQIAINLAHNRYWYWWRRKKDASISLDQSVGDNEEQGSSLKDLIPALDEMPPQNVMNNELVDSITEGIKSLNHRHQEILILRNKDDLSYEEIARKLKISVGTVKSRLARAREKLREQLGNKF